jgi:hypothetical protein
MVWQPAQRATPSSWKAMAGAPNAKEIRAAAMTTNPNLKAFI